MEAIRARLESIATGRWFPLFALGLVGIRFASPSISAALSIGGYDTVALDEFFVLYAGLLPAMLAILIAVLIFTWPGGFGRDRWLLLGLVLTVWDVAFWSGEVAPGYRLVRGSWATLPLGLGVTATILTYGVALEMRLPRGSLRSTSREGFRALYGGFALAYLLGSLRFIDYRYAFGAPPPSGWLWFLNYGPVLILCSLSVYFWVLLAMRPASGVGEAVRSLAIPLLGALAGFAVSQGLGGFILSNVLAWGGAFEVFVPTSLSLAIVGFAVGAFLATGWALRGGLAGRTWGFVIGGVFVTALAGILAFSGTLASLAGILFGLICAARGLSLRESRSTGVTGEASRHPSGG